MATLGRQPLPQIGVHWRQRMKGPNWGFWVVDRGTVRNERNSANEIERIRSQAKMSMSPAKLPSSSIGCARNPGSSVGSSTHHARSVRCTSGPSLVVGAGCKGEVSEPRGGPSDPCRMRSPLTTSGRTPVANTDLVSVPRRVATKLKTYFLSGRNPGEPETYKSVRRTSLPYGLLKPVLQTSSRQSERGLDRGGSSAPKRPNPNKKRFPYFRLLRPRSTSLGRPDVVTGRMEIHAQPVRQVLGAHLGVNGIRVLPG